MSQLRNICKWTETTAEEVISAAKDQEKYVNDNQHGGRLAIVFN